jgi:tRNAThr (cytosine32-N3)-methyltransferase
MRELVEADVWSENAWDNVELDLNKEQIMEIIRKQASENVQNPQFNVAPHEFWDEFYRKNGVAFFKDRKWLMAEYKKELTTQAKLQVMEFGCGVGNSIRPLLNDTNHYITGVDYSKEAIDLIKNDPEFNNQRLNVFTWDITTQIPLHLSGSMDIILCIFVLSALHPASWEKVVDNIYDLLKPGGIVLFRDYGRYDLTQLRFKSQRWLDDNFYVRGDGTRVYFFTNEELDKMFNKFDIIQNHADNRLLINRKKMLKMYRIWMQGKFKKPLS